MPQPIPPFLPVSALSVDLDAYASIAAAMSAGFADARATFECTLPPLHRDVGFFVLGGLEPLVEALERLKLKTDELTWLESAGVLDMATFERLGAMRFTCDVDAPPEGSIVFPGEPVLTVEGPFWQAQLVAALVRGSLGPATAVATRAARLSLAANGGEVVDAGSSTAHRLGGSPLLARAAFIGGAGATTSALAARRYRIPARVSLPFALALGAPDVERAMVAWTKTMRDRPALRLDPRSPLTSLSAIVGALKRRGAQRFGRGDIAIEVVDGDQWELGRAAVDAFKSAGLPEPTLVASGDLDERRIADLSQRRPRFSAFLVTSLADGDPTWHPAYDLVAIERDGQWAPRIRVDRTAATSSDPGRKVVVRYVDKEGSPLCDVAHATKERFAAAGDVRFVDRATAMPTRLRADSSSPLAEAIMRQGRRVRGVEPARTIRERALKNVKALGDRFRRLNGPDLYPVGSTPALLEVKESLLSQARGV